MAGVNGIAGCVLHSDRSENGLIDAIIEPIQEAAAVLDDMSNGNLKTSVKGNYKGEKESSSVNSLNQLNPDVLSLIEEMSSKNRHYKKDNGSGVGAAASKSRKISLNEREFGKY